MGWADLLIRLQVPYPSERAVQLGSTLMQFIQQKSRLASALLADQRGPFLNWAKSIYFPDRKLRNATTNSIAPTGSIGLIAVTSSSIEPLFSLAYQRQVSLSPSGRSLAEVNPLFLDYLDQHQLPRDAIMEQISARGHLNGTEDLPKEALALFQTALQIPYTYHLRHQAAFQNYIDNGVAKTINLPQEASVDDVAAAYQTAWQYGLKGITVYRYGSRTTQVLYEGLATPAQERSAGPVCAFAH